MKTQSMPLLLALILLIAVTVAAQLGDTIEKESEEKVFPKGDPKKGALVFEVKYCHRCHVIPGRKFPEIDLPAIDNISLGGENNVDWSRDDYAHHIMDPAHIISPDHQKAMLMIGDKLGAESSPMPSFNDLMTVEDLINLATYLEEVQ